MKLPYLKKYLRDNIPLSQALGMDVVRAGVEKIILFAPIAPNKNHQKTVFGGSLHALATLAAWSLVFVNLQKKEISADIVITSSTIKYIRPVTADFEAISILHDKDEWNRFEERLKRWGKSRIEIKAQIFQDDLLAVDYMGEFAAIEHGS